MNKNYDINFYDKEKAEIRNKYFKNGPLIFESGLDTNKIFFDYVTDEIRKNPKKKLSILDLGTGTGYVPKTLCQITNVDLKIIGVDLSQDMIDVAKQERVDKRIIFKLANNHQLPFKKASFDIITNKLSTQFSFEEVYRVLKKNGIFIFKEYGVFKGFKEISKIFGKKFRGNKKLSDDYAKEIIRMDCKEIIVQKFLIKRKYKLNEIKDIFSMANLIKNFGEKDLQKIKSKLYKNNKIVITSDPFIIFVRK